jgi:hypothetical protein
MNCHDAGGKAFGSEEVARARLIERFHAKERGAPSEKSRIPQERSGSVMSVVKRWFR